MAKNKTKSEIQVFKAEADAGISEKVRSNASVAYVAELWNTHATQEAVAEVIKSIAGVGRADDQFDLFYLNTILVTTGWNKNADVFPKSETWAARYTPVDKQFNLEHDQSKIIGHMTTAKAVDENFNLIAEDTSVDVLPDKFHILTGAVIYRALSNPEAQESIETLIAEIEAGDWYVSMECLFRGFDYAVITADGQKKFLERNEETAFLTKHLRQYGGSGEYKDYKLGRALKNITFSGKGLVRKPANPESVILFNQAVASFNAKFEDLGVVIIDNKISKNEPENVVMANDVELDNKVKDFEKKIADLTELNKSMADTIKTFESSQTTAKITNLENELAAKSAKLADLETDLATVKATNVELNTKVVDAESRASKVEKELNGLKSAEITRSRIAILTDLNAPKEKAESLVKLFSDKSDEDFKVIANEFAPTWVKVEDKPNTDTSSAKVIEDAEPETPPVKAAASNDETETSLASRKTALVGFFTNQLKNGEGK